MQATGRPSLSERENFLDRRCAACTKPNSRLHCRRCAVSDIGHIRVFYCSPVCQEAHWDTHRVACRALVQLSRAVSLFADLWAMVTPDYCPVVAKYVRENQGVVEMMPLAVGEDPRPWLGQSVLDSFIKGPAPNRLKPTIQAAVFGMQNCSPLSLTAQPLLEYLFKDFCTLLEGQVEIKDPAVVVRFGASYFSHHFLLIAELKTGERFAIDFEGVKHGWKEILYRLDSVYARHRTTGDIQWSPLGGLKAAQAEKLDNAEWDSDIKAVKDFGEHAIGFIIRGLLSILTLEKMRFEDLFALPQEKYAVTRELLLAKSRMVLDHVKGVMDRAGMPRTYYDAQYRLHVVIREENLVIFKPVWLTEQEYERNKQGKEALLAVWQAKLGTILHDLDTYN